MRKIIYSMVCLAIFFASRIEVVAQDLHYSQFYNSPLNVNPALTGVFRGDQRMIGSLRDQWEFVPVPWQTFSLSYDQKLYRGDREKQFFAFGANFNYDRQGDSKLNLSNLNVMGSYTRILNPNNVLTGGVLIGFATRGFNAEDLTWDKQWNGDSFDGSIGSGENFDATRVSFLENAIGLNYRWQQDSRTNADLGIGVFHLIEPSVTYYDGDSEKLPRRFAFYGIGNVQLVDALDVQLNLMHQRQESYDETVLSGLAKMYVSRKRGKETQVHVGLGYRTSGSFFPVVAVEYRGIYASFSYDADVTEFNDLGRSNNGGPELHVRYVITHVKPMKALKLCPIY